jgi:signal transduction histidine kinase
MDASILQSLQLATTAGILAIAGLALKDWLGRRSDAGRGYLALAIGCLGIVSVMSHLTPAVPAALRGPVGDLSLVVFMASGLALLLFRDTVIPLGRRLKAGAVATTGAVALASIVVQLPSGTNPQYTPAQFAVLIALVILWCLSVGEPSVRMWLIARRLPAVQQARLRALSLGYGVIVAILVSAVAAGSAATTPAVQFGIALASLALVPLLYAGFAPPTWLRRAWRHGEEQQFQHAIHDLLIFSPDRTTLAAKALEWALRMAGARQGFIAFPGTTIIASHGITVEEADRLSREIGNRAGILMLRSDRDAIQPAIATPLVTENATGIVVLLAGPFTPVFGADEVAWIGQYAALVATGLERVVLIEKMEDLNRQLADTVQQVTSQKTELEAANRELEAYSYTISHDLRAPLRAINGFTAILLEEHAGELSASAGDFLRRVGASGKHMSVLVDDLLAFSRLGRQALRKQSVDTTQVARQAWDQVRAGADGRPVDIHIADLPISESDPVLLEQVFANLLSNALKYSRGRPSTTIEVGAQVDRSGEAVFYVKDNGVGFDMQYVGKLFRVFERLHRNDQYEGTGVGLATVQRIVQRHGGRVWAEAAPDKGATFYFTLKGAHEWQAVAA